MLQFAIDKVKTYSIVLAIEEMSANIFKKASRTLLILMRSVSGWCTKRGNVVLCSCGTALPFKLFYYVDTKEDVHTILLI